MTEQHRQDLRRRTKAFALRIIRLYAALPKATEAQVLGKQMLRSGTSVGAHYREANRAKSDADFVSKMEGGLQELDETAYWLELLIESGIMAEKRLKPLYDETEELIAIFVTIVKNIKGKGNVKGKRR
jgi:four helix bundle protein